MISNQRWDMGSDFELSGVQLTLRDGQEKEQSGIVKVMCNKLC